MKNLDHPLHLMLEQQSELQDGIQQEILLPDCQKTVQSICPWQMTSETTYFKRLNN